MSPASTAIKNLWIKTKTIQILEAMIKHFSTLFLIITLSTQADLPLTSSSNNDYDTIRNLCQMHHYPPKYNMSDKQCVCLFLFLTMPVVLQYGAFQSSPCRLVVWGRGWARQSWTRCLHKWANLAAFQRAGPAGRLTGCFNHTQTRMDSDRKLTINDTAEYIIQQSSGPC